MTEETEPFENNKCSELTKYKIKSINRVNDGFRKLQNIDECDEYLVNGYVRECSKQLKMHYIPHSVVVVILIHVGRITNVKLVMEAVLRKKSPKKRMSTWQPRLFRLKDRRLMHFKKGVLNPNTTLDSQAKYTLDLTNSNSLEIDKKNANTLTIYHPVINLSLRFKTVELFICWLKVFSASMKGKITGDKRIKTSVPSNYLYSIWHTLQALYQHPNLQTTEGIFMVSSVTSENRQIFNQLLQQTYDLKTLQNYKNVHVLANLLCALLRNLPSTLFKEKQIEILVTFFTKERIAKHNVIHKQGPEHVDDDISNIGSDYVDKLKLSMETLYLSNKVDRKRYGLMTLIFHLLKEITLNEENTKQTAESLSIVFAEIFESKTHLIKMKDQIIESHRAEYLVKALIYWAYEIFPKQQWRMEDIIVAEKCESDYINEYNSCHVSASASIV